MTEIDRGRLETLFERERVLFEETHPRSKAAYASAEHLFGRVPMTWMNKKAGSFPVYFESAKGNKVRDIDGNEYVDFALGDTGAMAGHAAPEVTAAIVRHV